MSRTIRIFSWTCFAAILYLILAEAAQPWFPVPGMGNIGFVLVFVLFSVGHCWAVEGAKRTAIFFAISALVTYAMEEIGVRTGLVFGPYHYSDSLGIKLGHVPVLIPLGWFMMIYPSRAVAKAMLGNVDARSIRGIASLAALAAVAMTGWDLVMDPGMALAGNWIWENGGVYFGVPLQNFFGWLLTTFVVYGLTGWLWRGEERKVAAAGPFVALPVIVYAVFALRYVAANRFPELQAVAVFSMGIPALASLLRIRRPRLRGALVFALDPARPSE